MSSRSVHPLGEIIKNAIKGTGISQAKIADRMGVPRQTINQLDIRKTFDFEFLQKLKDASGLDFTNYIFNPKSKKYEEFPASHTVRDPEGQYSKSIEVSLTLKIHAQEGDFSKIGALMNDLREQAGKHGFIIQ